MVLSRGQAALSLVFLVGGIVFVAAVSIALFALSFINAGYGFEATQHLTAADLSGVNDALLQLDRNRSFSNPGYTVTADTAATTVVVAQNTPVSNQATITATAALGLRSRKMQAVVAINQTTGEITVLSLQ